MALLGDVTANLIAAGVGAGATYVVRDKILPIVRGRLRQLPKLDGSVWERKLDKPGVTSTMTIHQSGTSLKATVERRGETVPRTFVYHGQISGHQIVLTWKDKASSEQLIGSMVLHISAQLNQMNGFTVYFRHDAGTVVAVPCTYGRLVST